MTEEERRAEGFMPLAAQHTAEPMVEVTVKVSLPRQFVDDVVCTAFEGGINYWCSRQVPSEARPEGAEYGSDYISRGGSNTIYVSDDNGGEEDETHVLTLQNFAEGFVKWAINTANDNILDAEDADQVIQYALFGEAVYG